MVVPDRYPERTPFCSPNTQEVVRDWAGHALDIPLVDFNDDISMHIPLEYPFVIL